MYILYDICLTPLYLPEIYPVLPLIFLLGLHAWLVPVLRCVGGAGGIQIRAGELDQNSSYCGD